MLGSQNPWLPGNSRYQCNSVLGEEVYFELLHSVNSTIERPTLPDQDCEAELLPS